MRNGFIISRILTALCAVLAISTAPSPAEAGEVTVAAASNFSRPAQEIAAAFEQQSGHRARLVFGSSGKIFAQISHGAPFDVFLSADRAKPAALERQGRTEAHSRFTYAVGALALWAPKINRGLDFQDLTAPAVGRIAIANPDLAPYGAAAREVLRSLNLYQQLGPKLVRGENIAQTYQFVASGNADIGFIAASQLPPQGQKQGQKPAGSVKVIDGARHRPIEQDAVLLKSAADNPAARAFIAFLRSAPARKIIRAHGYRLPESGG